MNKTDRNHLPLAGEPKKRFAFGRRAQSVDPVNRIKDTYYSSEMSEECNDRIFYCKPVQPKQQQNDRKCASLTASSSSTPSKKSLLNTQCASSLVSMKAKEAPQEMHDVVLPNAVVSKIVRAINTKRREFAKSRKQLVNVQNAFLEQYTQLKELESRAGIPVGDSIGEVRIVSVTGWSANDLLLLIRDEIDESKQEDLGGSFGSNILSQLTSQLNTIPENILSMAGELLDRRVELLKLLRGRHHLERSPYCTVTYPEMTLLAPCNKKMGLRSKLSEFDQETEKLQALVSETAKNVESKINYTLEVAKIPWHDRDSLLKKLERVQRELAISQNRIEELTGTTKKEEEKDPQRTAEKPTNYMLVVEELNKERAAREALKDVVAAAESMLRVARARITTLERQYKEARNELEVTRRKHKDLEQLYRHRESSFDARSKKLLELSKTGEAAIDALSRQRDALELRVRELREQSTAAEQDADVRQAQEKARADALQAKVVEQENSRKATEIRVRELEVSLQQMTEKYNELFDRSKKLVEVERRRCLEYVPVKERNPTERETDIWKELQVIKASLAKTEDELLQSRADKDNLLNSLSRIAEEGPHNKMAEELLDRERKITDYQQIIQDLKENEKMMEQSIAKYENRVASMRLEIKRLRNYDCYIKDAPHQELQTELLELCLQVETLTRERSMLVTAAASRALMLERNERSASMFARVTRVRRDLAAQLAGEKDVPSPNSSDVQVWQSLSSICASAGETWTALRAERARVLQLESAVLAQSLQLEREECVRTQLERRRALLEREIIRVQQQTTPSPPAVSRNSMVSLLCSLLNFKPRDDIVEFIRATYLSQDLKLNSPDSDIETELPATSGLNFIFNFI